MTKTAEKPGGRYAEVALLLVLVAATVITILVAVDKMAFLSFYQLPVLIAAYVFGRRQGVMVAVASVLMVSIYAAINPAVFAVVPERGPAVAIFLWGAFTILGAYLVGTLYDAKAAARRDLEQAYSGLIDILSEFVDAVDDFADNRSVRVAKLSARIGVAMNLPVAEIENLRVAGLLHDVHTAGVSLEVLRKASHSKAERSAEETGADLARRSLKSSGGLLRDVVPLVELYHENFDGTGPGGLSGESIPQGARILCVANAFERAMTPAPFGAGMTVPEALMSIETDAGKLYDPAIVDALIMVSEAAELDQ